MFYTFQLNLDLSSSTCKILLPCITYTSVIICLEVLFQIEKNNKMERGVEYKTDYKAMFLSYFLNDIYDV